MILCNIEQKVGREKFRMTIQEYSRYLLLYLYLYLNCSLSSHSIKRRPNNSMPCLSRHDE
ncbi:hypothetical protein P168DRAFT_183995 [Aspergillus campestris IBT 28561]|uniref:Uncharacterized protein n=1 Tax=Aspergillus campestris (strain IBT 28561) TaxID=1392248 RepID=A0A2I1CXR8_ASPC2|nr:uncharacterized protein P168DRAFT_183995 [Aspergillus campestris IBT 28561]PKY02429.1 hypothetical protein P168DRAFT_183995 [Aspergillus campestris IBT 28561]